MQRHGQRSSKALMTMLLVASLVVIAEAGFYKMMSDMWDEGGWESKGISFGIKSKGMTAIIPFPLPIPIFSKGQKGGGGGGGDKGGGGGGGGWEAPAEGGGGGGWWR